MDMRQVQNEEKKNQQTTPHDYNEIHHKEEKIQDDRIWILDGPGFIHKMKNIRKGKRRLLGKFLTTKCFIQCLNKEEHLKRTVQTLINHARSLVHYI